MFGRVLISATVIMLLALGAALAQDDSSIVIDSRKAAEFMIKLPAAKSIDSEWPVPYLDSILDWSLTAPTGDSGRALLRRADPPEDIDSYWFRTSGDNPLIRVRPRYGADSDQFNHVMILQAMEYRAFSFSFFSLWQRIGPDMSLVRLIPNPSQHDDLFCQPLFSATFPDGSLLIASSMNWADGDTREEDYHFVRIDQDYNATEFYAVMAAYAYSGRRVTIGDRAAIHGNYQVIITTEFLSRIEREYTYEVPGRGSRTVERDGVQEFSRIDSVSTEVVDLWELAVTKLGLDTTGINNE